MGRRSISGLVLAGGLLVGVHTAGADPAQSLKQVAADPGFVEVVDGPQVAVSLRYATTTNFMHANLYGGFCHAYLRREAYEKFAAAEAILAREHPGWRFLIWDALRPRSVQWVFWGKVAGTPQEKYVADPHQGSVHNYGFALDLSLIDRAGRPIDMGTDFDNFTIAAEPPAEDDLVAKGRLTAAQVSNRRILRDVMTRAGFATIAEEWWHFDALPKAELKARYTIVE
jgi:D-alanyl-D-alanine dipeptidase